MNSHSGNTVPSFRPHIQPKVIAVLWYLLDNFPDHVVLVNEMAEEHAAIFTIIHREGGARHDVVVMDEFIETFENCALELHNSGIIELMSNNISQPASITVAKDGITLAEGCKHTPTQ